MKNKLSIVQEENLCCELRCQYPVIFDKSHKMWRKTHSKKSLLLLIFYWLVSLVKHHFNQKLSWKQLCFCLKRNNIHIKYHLIINLSGEVVKHIFDKIKRQYLAKRLELKKMDKFGTFSSVVEKARNNLNAYSLFWIDKYLKPQRTKSNIKDINTEMSADDVSEAAENMPSFQEFVDQPFNEEQIPDATQKGKSALQSEKLKRAKKFSPWREAFVNTKPNWQRVERREQS